MKKLMLLAGMSVWTAAAVAGPAVKADPVASMYPDWQNVTPKNLIAGREVCPSDLRHKTVIVVEVQTGEKLKSQLMLAATYAMRGAFALKMGENWETVQVTRGVVEVVSVHGPNARKEVTELLQTAKTTKDQELGTIRQLDGNGCVIGEDLTFPGAPDNGGQYPFVYVLGPNGKEPLYKGVLSKATYKDVHAAYQKANAETAALEWQPFVGSVKEPKYPQLTKALEKGKPLDPVAKAILKDVTSSDEAKAKEAQILFDAMNQTRSDLVMRIGMEASACPHRAAYDIQEVLKYWPSEKKRIESLTGKIRSNPDTELLSKVFCKLMDWADPNFTCKNTSEAKKIVQELNKMKKGIAPLKESKNLSIQNGALLIDLQIDDLITAIPTKVK